MSRILYQKLLRKQKSASYLEDNNTVKLNKDQYFLSFYRGLESTEMARRNSPFAPFSAFRPVSKIGDILHLNQESPSIHDSGEICEVSTTVDKDEESEEHQRIRKNAAQDEVIDVETEEKAKEVKSEPQVNAIFFWNSEYFQWDLHRMKKHASGFQNMFGFKF